MSEPYRWRVADNQTQRTLGGNIMELHETGPYVLWHDYARLKSEVERLRDGVETMTYHASGVTTTAWVRAVEYDRLKAKVERLTKAGDAIAYGYQNGDWNERKIANRVSAWEDAKEGKQP